APADRRQFDRSEFAAEVDPGLFEADRAPPQGRQHLPPQQIRLADAGAAMPRVRVEKLRHSTESADRQRPAEAPHAGTQPAQVLPGIAAVGELPVEDGPDSVGADDEVAVAEVAVHHGGANALGPGRAQPAQAEFERGPWRTDAVEH